MHFNKLIHVPMMALALLSTACLTTSCGGSTDKKEEQENHDTHAGAPGHEGHEGHNHGHEGHNHGAEAAKPEGKEIAIEPADAKRFGIETEKVEPGSFSEVLKVSGEVLPSMADRSIAAAPTSGTVKLAPGITEGVMVRQGQLIARVSADNISGGNPDRSARVAVEAAKRELDRLTPLLKDGIITKREYNQALAAYESARAAYSPKAASGAVTAPRAGVISSIDLPDGAYVSAGEPIASIASNNSLTLRALVPNSQASFLKYINNAIVTLSDDQSIDLKEFGGRLLSSAPAGAASTPGYSPVYFSFRSNPDLLPGTGVEVFLTGSDRSGVISVPVSALSEQIGNMFVYVKVDAEGYVKVPVKIGASNGRRVEILSGLAPGQQVVVKGTSFVRLAETSGVAPEGHSHNH